MSAARARTRGAVGHARRALGGAVLVLATGCAPAPAPLPAPHAVRYQLAWERAGVTRASDGSWAVVNDLGYRVRVQRGWVTSYGLELVECPKAAARGWIGLAIVLGRPQLEGTAWAGHGTGTPNPAALRPMQVESLTRAEPREVGTVTLAPQTYCKLHYLVARAGRDAPGLPSELDMVDTTLHVEGTFRAPAGGAETPFTVHTASAYGQLFERAGAPAAPIRIDTGAGAVRVEVRRRLARMFDGVDFARLPERARALRILKALVDHAQVAVERVDG